MTDSEDIAIDAIKKKLVGKTLTYPEVFAVMDEIAHDRLGPVLTTYFAAAGFKEGFSLEELYFLTKSMVETGPKLSFPGIVADKHSIGGVAGARTSMILVPIIAAAGYTIPKNSSRAITSPSGTADTMEVLSPVTFTMDEVYRIVEKVGGCIVWGGHLGLAPADDVIIQIEEPLAFESYDKAIVAIMAKKIASGANHVIFDVPVGETMKVHHQEDAAVIKKKLLYLAERFSISLSVDINETRETPGQGVGPVLEARDALRVLEQHPDRAMHLEEKSLRLAGKLLSLCLGNEQSDDGMSKAKELLQSGKALQKMKEIIAAQGGDPAVESSSLVVGEYVQEVPAKENGTIINLDNGHLSRIARILGCPDDKRAGIWLSKRIGDSIVRGDILCTFYSSDQWRLKEAVDTLSHLPMYEQETTKS